MDIGVLYPVSNYEAWDIISFYRTTEESVLIYTAKLTENGSRFEWALYRFSSNGINKKY
jgi:hypothetical protein